VRIESGRNESWRVREEAKRGGRKERKKSESIRGSMSSIGRKRQSKGEQSGLDLREDLGLIEVEGRKRNEYSRERVVEKKALMTR